MGKGDKRRPEEPKQYRDGYDRIFGKSIGEMVNPYIKPIGKLKTKNQLKTERRK